MEAEFTPDIIDADMEGEDRELTWNSPKATNPFVQTEPRPSIPASEEPRLLQFARPGDCIEEGATLYVCSTSRRLCVCRLPLII